jgi:hypothetical protein
MHCLLSKLLVIICSKAGLCGLRNLESVAALQPNQQRGGLTARALLLLQFESEMPRGLKVSNCRPQARNSFLHNNASVCLHLGCVPTPLAAWNSKDSKHGQMGISRTPRWHHLPAVLSRMYGDFIMIWCEDMCLPSARGHRHTPAVLKRRPLTTKQPPNPKHSCRSATNRSLSPVKKVCFILPIYASSGISREGREEEAPAFITMG